MSRFILLFLLAAVACDGIDPTELRPGTGCDTLPAGQCGEPPPVQSLACDPQDVPAGRACVRWAPAYTYRLDSRYDADILVVDPGTVVRLGEHASIAVERILVRGTAHDPVQFLPAGANAWHWIELLDANNLADTSIVQHAHIVNARNAIVAREPIIAEQVRVTDIEQEGITLTAGGLLRRVTIDSAGGSGIVIAAFRLRSPTGGTTRLEDIDVSRADTGIHVTCVNCRVHVEGGSIHDNRGTGLVVAPFGGDFRDAELVFDASPRITANGERPLHVPLSALVSLMRSSAAELELSGNASDTILAFTSGFHDIREDTITVRRSLDVRVQGCVYLPGSLVMEPGSSIVFEDGCDSHFVLRAAGTPAEPITIAGTGFGVLGLAAGGTDTVRIAHVRFRRLDVATVGTPAVLEHVVLDSVSLRLLTAGSRLHNVHSTGGGDAGAQEPAITLGSRTRMDAAVIEGSTYHGVHIIGPDVTVSDCAIRLSAGHAVLVEAAGARIEQCNLERNAGYAIHNAQPDTVSAPDNWWGDPAGPRGPDGDGIDGPIEWEPFRTTPWTIGGGAARAAHPQRGISSGLIPSVSFAASSCDSIAFAGWIRPRRASRNSCSNGA